jgi:hypothetical protein
MAGSSSARALDVEMLVHVVAALFSPSSSPTLPRDSEDLRPIGRTIGQSLKTRSERSAELRSISC